MDTSEIDLNELLLTSAEVTQRRNMYNIDFEDFKE